jgi:hypothetical protein
MRFWLIAGGCLAALQPALAENAPTGVLVGEIARNGSAQCFLNRGFSTFQRNFNVAVAAGTKAVISFPSAFCQGHELGGVAVLTFSGSNSGTIQFKRASDTTLGSQGTAFSNYSETYVSNTHEIIVKFDIPALWSVDLTLEASYP